MPFTTDGKNAALTALSNACTYASLHTGVPSTGTPNEVSGGSPAYARVQVSWTVSNGQATLSGQPSFNVPANTTVTYVGFWNAATGGTLEAYAQVTSETFGSQGAYVISAATLVISDS
jgi:hypothetical protein